MSFSPPPVGEGSGNREWGRENYRKTLKVISLAGSSTGIRAHTLRRASTGLGLCRLPPSPPAGVGARTRHPGLLTSRSADQQGGPQEPGHPTGSLQRGSHPWASREAGGAKKRNLESIFGRRNPARRLLVPASDLSCPDYNAV